MPSLDFVRDLEDILKSQGINFIIIALQRGKFTGRVDIFHHIPDEYSLTAFCEIIDKLKADLEKNRQEVIKAKVSKSSSSKKKKDK